MTPGTLVTVLGKYPGIVTPSPALEGFVSVAYHPEPGVNVWRYVPVADVKPRSMK